MNKRHWSIAHVGISLNESIANEERALNRIERSRKALDQVEAGQVIDGDEVMTWIASWGSNNEILHGREDRRDDS